jgi:hypothetical protein
VVGARHHLAEARKQFAAEAAAAGFAETAFGRIPKIQIATIEDLLSYRMPRLPAIDSSAFRKAPKEKSESQAGFDF